MPKVKFGDPGGRQHAIRPGQWPGKVGQVAIGVTRRPAATQQVVGEELPWRNRKGAFLHTHSHSPEPTRPATASLARHCRRQM